MKKGLMLLLLATAVISSCGSININPPAQESIFENIPLSMEFLEGDVFEFSPIIKTKYNSNNNFCYCYSGDVDLLDLTSSGKLTCYKVGTSSIKIFSDDNFNGILDEGEVNQNVNITINQNVNTISVNNIYVSTTAIDAYVDSIYHIDGEALPLNATHKKIRYISSNPSVSSVDAYGEVNNKREGDAIITVYNDENNNNVLDNNEISKLVFISTRYPEVSRTITLPDFPTGRIEMKVGEQVLIVPTISPNVSNPWYGYESADTNICVIGGKEVNKKQEIRVSALYPGKTTLQIRYEGAYAFLEVVVTPNESNTGTPLACKINLKDSQVVLNVNDQYQLNPILVPSNAVDPIVYSSNNENVVTVSGTGLIKAVGQGSATLTLSTGEGISTKVLVVVKPNTTYDDPFNGYYQNLSWDNSQDLINKLHDIIKVYTPLNYAKSNSTNWESNQYADEDINDNSKVRAIYASNPILKTDTGTGTGKWQREHCFAASLLTGVGTNEATTTAGRGTDFHNLYAALSSGNSSRGNKNYGEVNPLDFSVTINENYSYNVNVFEPDAYAKGKVARAIFYMSVMYNYKETMVTKQKWTFKTEEDIKNHSTASTTLTFDYSYRAVNLMENVPSYTRLSLDNLMANASPVCEQINEYYANELINEGCPYEVGSDNFRREIYNKYISGYANCAFGSLSTLIRWNTLAVDDQEKQHCDSVYSHEKVAKPDIGSKQGNRNPFVDYPELVNYIYGPLQDESGSIKMLKPQYIDK